MHIDRWHGDHLPAETELGRAVDRVLMSKPASYLFLAIGYAMTGAQVYYTFAYFADLLR